LFEYISEQDLRVTAQGTWAEADASMPGWIPALRRKMGILYFEERCLRTLEHPGAREEEDNVALETREKERAAAGMAGASGCLEGGVYARCFFRGAGAVDSAGTIAGIVPIRFMSTGRRRSCAGQPLSQGRKAHQGDWVRNHGKCAGALSDDAEFVFAVSCDVEADGGVAIAVGGGIFEWVWASSFGRTAKGFFKEGARTRLE
jgi:hypothetical protein